MRIKEKCSFSKSAEINLYCGLCASFYSLRIINVTIMRIVVVFLFYHGKDVSMMGSIRLTIALWELLK